VVLRRMARDLNFDVEVVGAPIVREGDGVALSSRNRHLTAEARSQARVLVGSLDAAERALRGGVCGSSEILARVRAELARAPLACVEYAELRDPDSLETCPETLSGPALLALAVDFPSAEGGEGARVRLIDNRVLYPHPHRQEPPR
jgi:pantoate--beta-alanine ligase